MSFWGIEPEDWFRRFFGSSSSRMPSPPPSSSIGRGGWFGDMPRQFDEMRREMQRMFEEQFKDIQSNIPKELVREYETPQGGKVREIGPLVYGYSMTIGPDDKPKVREFGNVRSLGGPGSVSAPGATRELRAEREPLADVVTSDKEVKIVVEMPGIDKRDIKVNVYDNSVEIFTIDTSQRKYRRVVELPEETDLETAKSTYRNGILEITFSKKESPKQKGKQINIE